MFAILMRRSKKQRRSLAADDADLWLLLRDAVDGAHAPDEWFAVDRHYLTSGKESLKRVHCTFVICVTKDRSEHDAIRNVEVCIAGRQTFEIATAGAAPADRSGHG